MAAQSKPIGNEKEPANAEDERYPSDVPIFTSVIP